MIINSVFHECAGQNKNSKNYLLLQKVLIDKITFKFLKLDKLSNSWTKDKDYLEVLGHGVDNNAYLSWNRDSYELS